MVYQPMLELLTFLRANNFKTFIVSGGGIQFMRPWTEKVYGIPPKQVIGSSGGLKYELRDGSSVIVKTPELTHNDDKAGKPIGIQRHIGRRPIAAFGNSDGDFQMLEWTTTGPGPRFGMIIHHTDAEREWAYDRVSHVGKLDKGLDEAPKRGWTVIDMKIPKLLLIAVGCWLVIIFLCFSLVAPPNPTTGFALVSAAVSVAGAIFMVLELDQPLGGMIRISSGPMTHALQQLEKNALELTTTCFLGC